MVYSFLKETKTRLSYLHPLWGWHPPSWGLLAVVSSTLSSAATKLHIPDSFLSKTKEVGRSLTYVALDQASSLVQTTLIWWPWGQTCSDGHGLQGLGETWKPCIWEMTGPAGLQWARCPCSTCGGSISLEKALPSFLAPHLWRYICLSLPTQEPGT